MQILKIGGSVITKKHGYMEPDEVNISRLAQTISDVWRKGVRDFVLIHGAGSFGHAPVLAHGIDEGIRSEKDRMGYADTHAACAYLSQMVVDAIIKNGVPAVSIAPAAIIRQKKKRIVKLDQDIVERYLKAGFLPVLYGDMVLDESIKGSVCSGDQISAYLGRKAKKIIMGTNVDGILVDGKVVQKIDQKNFPEIMKHVRSSAGAPDVTGGMEGKLKELMKLKVPVYVVNASKVDRVEALLTNRKTICTEIRM